jgi:hypothetical protein
MPRGDNNKRCSDEEFIHLFSLHGATEAAKILKCSERSIYKRRSALSQFHTIDAPSKLTKQYPHRAVLDVRDGCVIVGSDFHIWPGSESTALRAFKKFCKDLEPSAVILNGDVTDFPQISRHPPIGWESTPSPVEEIEAVQYHLNDIEQAAPRKCQKEWTLGNHDARFETRLATVASEYKNLKGIHLSDHFPNWGKGWSVWINNEVVCKHRWKGGIHATHNNTVGSGKTMVTGHLHSQKVTPFTDYNGTRYGIDTGCVAATDHKAFVDYSEDNPKNWISGFAVLTFKDGRMMYPELVSVWSEDAVQFRGQVLRV